MAKAVFRPGEITIINQSVLLEPPNAYPESAHLTLLPEEPAEIEGVDEFCGPTADELRREAELFKSQWDIEREALIRSAKAEADSIIKEAEETAFREVKRRTDEAQSQRRAAEDEAERILAEAQRKAADMDSASQAARERSLQEAEVQGREAGREAGYQEGREEVARLIQRTQVVLERAQDKRAEILAETEQQIIDLALLISRKVIKTISENQKTVVVSNVAQALRKVKGRGNILIRVNLADVKLTTEHIKDFIQLVEGAKGLQVIEDSSVDQGGCIIETDFGEIDARISSQLAELESKILEMSPLKGRAKPPPAAPPAKENEAGRT
ncbi:MAG: flagellar assembly protein FliH [Treponema sp.]|jgi:flagellar assembly protein FliH|nr:flagellar assembly protein FliH [Treponema sp.]